MNVLNMIFVTKNDKGNYIVIENSKQIKYIIKESDNLIDFYKKHSGHSLKSKIFGILIGIIPLKLLGKITGKIYKVNLKFNEEIEKIIDQIGNEQFDQLSFSVNVIVGTIGKYQKIILEISNKREKKIYVKCGNYTTRKLLKNEETVCKKLNNNNKINSINFITSYDTKNFTLNVYDEIKGDNIKQMCINSEIINVYKNISSFDNLFQQNNYDKNEMEFSHGDFTPWNMKVDYNNRYIVFDWEYAGYRFKGYDLIHYLFQTKLLLCNKEKDESIKFAVKEAKKFIPYLKMIDDEIIIEMYYEEANKLY